MLRLAWLVVAAQSAAARDHFRDHCSCHSVKSKTFTRLMFERGFRAAEAHRASDLKLSSPPPREMREGHPRARPMDADDPVHPCRKGGPRTNESWWLAENEAAVEQLRQAEAGEAPLGGTARKHLGLS